MVKRRLHEDIAMSNVESYITSVDSKLQPIVVMLRELIRNVSGELKEELKWNVPTYSMNKNICSIMAHKKHVNLQIFRGAELENTEALLGTGKAMRHLKFETMNDVEVATVSEIIKQALVIDRC